MSTEKRLILIYLPFSRFKTVEGAQKAGWQGLTCWGSVAGEQGLSQPE